MSFEWPFLKKIAVFQRNLSSILKKTRKVCELTLLKKSILEVCCCPLFLDPRGIENWGVNQIFISSFDVILLKNIAYLLNIHTNHKIFNLLAWTKIMFELIIKWILIDFFKQTHQNYRLILTHDTLLQR